MSPRTVFGPAFAVLLSLAAATSIQAGPRPINFARPLNAFDSALVERVRAGAVRRLQAPECAKVLTEFTDREGRTLDRNLEPWGLSAPDYLRMIHFRDGSSVPHCEQRSVQLVSIPRMLPVFLCPDPEGPHSKLAAVEAKNPALAEFMVIHEMPHTLGLGENPPSTFEITERVRKRCQ
jgi:hypothetical protein